MGRFTIPLPEKIRICQVMMSVEGYYGDQFAVDYWQRRINGYKKLLQSKMGSVKA